MRGHKVITILNWHYNPADSDEEDIQTQQCIAVDLQSGEITEVTPRQKEPVQCIIEGSLKITVPLKFPVSGAAFDTKRILRAV